MLPAQVQELLNIPLLHQHPAGDLSLLASAASEQASALDTSSAPSGQSQHNNKRRKTAPRKLGSYLLNNSSHLNRDQISPSNGNCVIGSDDDNGGHSDKDTEKENHHMALQMIKKECDTNGSLKDGFLLSNNKIANGKLAAAAMNLSKSVISSNSMVKQEKGDESLDLTVKTLMTPGDTSQSPSPPTSTSQLPFLSSSILPTSSSSPLNLLVK